MLLLTDTRLPSKAYSAIWYESSATCPSAQWCGRDEDIREYRLLNTTVGYEDSCSLSLLAFKLVSILQTVYSTHTSALIIILRCKERVPTSSPSWCFACGEHYQPDVCLPQDTALDPGEDVALLSVSFEDAEATQVFPKLYLSPSIEQ